jgi:hypothetical protein
MSRSSRLLLSMVVGLSVAAPSVAFGKQRGGGSGSGSTVGTAVPRTGGDAGSSSSGAGAGSSGGSSGSSSSGGGEARTSPPPPPSPPPDADRRAPTSSSTRTGSTAKPRSGSGTTTSGSAASARTSGGSSDVTVGGAVVNGSARDRNGRPIVGTAVSRPVGNGIATYPVYGPWGVYSPWYGSGFGWNFGYAYNPWGYFGAASWMWGRYGLWYDPYAFGLYPYDPFYGYGTYGTYGYSTSRPENEDAPSRSEMGSLRIKASPSNAKVYVDGTLMGTVDDFNGLSNHLKMELGSYRLELRADGYETVSKDVTVTTGTSTIRLELKKKQ